MTGNHNLLASDRVAVVGQINPASHSAGSVSTGWVDMSKFATIAAIVQAGVLGSSATLDAKIEQAQDGSGTGVKDVAGKAITQLTKAGSDDNKQAVINVRQANLDANNGFTHARLTITVGTADSVAAATLLGLDPRYGAASDADASTVDEIVA
jgi:hypothetical protein